MKMKKELFSLLGVIISAIALTFGMSRYANRIQRLETENGNLCASLDSLTHQKYNDSLDYVQKNAYLANELVDLREVLSQNELKMLKSLDVKRKDVASMSVTASRATVNIPLPSPREPETPREAIRGEDPEEPPLVIPRSFRYSDEWTDVALHGDTLSIATRDSIVTVCERVYKHHFLWWRWGYRGCKVKLVNFNPHTTITYNKFVVQE